MAADQRRKRLHGASIVGHGSREQHRTKRKNLGFVHNGLSMRSHISIEWDGNQKRVVAKREQIGITWRQMKPFVNFVSNHHKVLADVFTIPQDIFDLDNLSEVLSYEVWKTHLSENERNLLINFLPSGLDPHEAVEELLSGNNFHFGNPFLKWGSSLCLGDLHPDIIVDREQHLMSVKKAYYSQLHNYHNDMIGYLVNLKEKWQSCRDPVKEIVQKKWRSYIDVEKGIPSMVNGSRVYDHDGNVTLTSESGSWDTEEKAGSGDNQISSLRKDDKLQRRVLAKGIVKGKSRNLMVSSNYMTNVGERPKKGDKLPKLNIHSSDGDKYMSCIKISKQQHELVKSMKQSGKSIQSRSLNRVLGNLDNVHVQPYEAFVKDEQKKLHEHWLQLVNKDFPVAYENWTKRQKLRHAVMNSLVAEMKDKSPLLEEEENVSPGGELLDQDEDNVSSEGELQDQDEDNMSLGSKLQDEDEDSASSGSKLQDEDEDEDSGSSGSKLQDEDEDSVSSRSKLQDEDEDNVSSGIKLEDNVSSGSKLEDQDEDNVSSGIKLQDQDEDNVSSGSKLQDLNEDNVSSGIKLQDQDEDNVSSGSKLQDMDEDNVSSGIKLQDMDEDNVSSGTKRQDQAGEGGQNDHSSSKGDEDSVVRSLENHSPPNSICNGGDELNPMRMSSEKKIVSPNSDDALRNMNTHDVSINEGAPFASGCDVWQAVEMPHSYYNSAVTHGYTAHGLSQANPPVNEEEQTHLIDLEADLRQEETGKELLHRQLDDVPFSSYQGQDRSDLLQSLFKGEEVLPYHHEQKGAELDFQTSNNVVMVDSQFSGHFKEPLQTPLTLDQGQCRASNVYMPDNMSQNIYSDEGRYLINRQGLMPRQDLLVPREDALVPRQDPLAEVHLNDWVTNTAHIPAPSQPQLSTGHFIGHHWVPPDHHARGGWNGSDNGSLSSQSLGTAPNSDQSLFSILSQCSQLRTSSTYDPVGHTDQYLAPRTYGVVDPATPRTSAVVPQTSRGLDYLSGREAPSGLMNDDVAWMSMPHQNSTLHDQMGKPYLRSWNR